jgi:hypothetical protein
VIKRRVVVGLGVDEVIEAIEECEGESCWWEAAQMWFAVGTLNLMAAGKELKRAWAAIRHLPETAESMKLENKICPQLLWAMQDGNTLGGAEQSEVMQRMKELDDKAPRGDFDTLCGRAMGQSMQIMLEVGMAGYVPLTRETVLKAVRGFAEAESSLHEALQVAPDRILRDAVSNMIAWMSSYHWMHGHVDCNADFTAPDESFLRATIEAYDFESMHATIKSKWGFDHFLVGGSTSCMLLWYGDIKTARVGWLKQIDAWRQISCMIQRGEHTWNEYSVECALDIYKSPGDMLLAGEKELLREWLQHTPAGIVQRDPLFAKEWETIRGNLAFMWQGPDGYCMVRPETWSLLDRALVAVATDGKLEEGSVREWLPRPEQLLDIARHEYLCFFIHGSVHPAMLCASLYTRLGAWDEAAAVANGLLGIPHYSEGKGFGTSALLRIEAWRLLARCRGAYGDATGACEALEQAASESQAVGYIFLQVESLREMVAWVEGDSPLPGVPSASSDIQARIDELRGRSKTKYDPSNIFCAVESGFR